MRLLKPFLLALLMAFPGLAQIPQPQLNLSGNIGCQGFACLNNGTIPMSDASRNMTALETSAVGGFVVTGTWTADHTLTVPAGGFAFLSAGNGTSGGHNLILCSASGGSCLTIPNGQAATGVWFNGTNMTGALPGSGGGIPTSPSNCLVKINGSNGACSSLFDNGTAVTTSESFQAQSLIAAGASGAAGPVVLTEGTPYSGSTPGVDALWGNGSTHRVQMLLNGTGGALNVPGVATAITSGHLFAAAPNGIDMIDGGAAGGVSSSANLDTSTGQAQVDSIPISAQFGMVCLGDSLTTDPPTGATTSHCKLDQAAWNIPNGLYNNDAASGNTAGDVAFNMMNDINPGDDSNPITIVMDGTNDWQQGTPALPSFLRIQSAIAAFAATSSTYKTAAASMTPTGSPTTDTTFANAHGLTFTATGTASTTCNVGPSGTIFNIYKTTAAAGAYQLLVDGTAALDVIQNSTTTQTQTTETFNHTSVSVAAAQYNGITQGAHTCAFSWVSGTATDILLVTPPEARNRGFSAPSLLLDGVIPEQNNGNASIIGQFNTVSLNVQKAAVAAGLNVRFGNVNPLNYTTNFAGSGSLPLHLGQAGQEDLAHMEQSVVGATPYQAAGSGPTDACASGVGNWPPFGPPPINVHNTMTANVVYGIELPATSPLCTINAIGFAAAPGGAVGYLLNIWNAAGTTILAQVNPVTLSADNWYNEPLASAFQLQQNTTYLITITADTTGATFYGTSTDAGHFYTTGLTVPRMFSCANPSTGSGGSLAPPATCGTRTALSSAYAPMSVVFFHQ